MFFAGALLLSGSSSAIPRPNAKIGMMSASPQFDYVYKPSECAEYLLVSMDSEASGLMKQSVDVEQSLFVGCNVRVCVPP